MNTRFTSKDGKSKEHVEAPRKDPEEEVFGKKYRTGDEVVDEVVSGVILSLMKSP